MLYNSTGKFHQLHLDVTHVHVKCMIMPLIIHPWVGKTLLFLVVCLYCCTFKNSKKIKKKKKKLWCLFTKNQITTHIVWPNCFDFCGLLGRRYRYMWWHKSKQRHAHEKKSIIIPNNINVYSIFAGEVWVLWTILANGQVYYVQDQLEKVIPGTCGLVRFPLVRVRKTEHRWLRM